MVYQSNLCRSTEAFATASATPPRRRDLVHRGSDARTEDVPALKARALLEQVASGPGAPQHLHSPEQLLYLTQTNYELIANLIGSEERLIILTTLELRYRGEEHSGDQLAHMRNFAYHLNSIGRLRNTLTVSYTEATCRLLLSVGIPCFVDRIAPKTEELPKRLQSERGHFAKYWHALALLRLGINIYFSDSDAAILQDPFAFQDKRYDIEGLSDWNHQSDVPLPRGMAEHPCPLYITKKDEIRAQNHAPGSSKR
ncbi:hypothetical protein WJX84_001399 [Apatococcus fuscideae]|uniref:Nucleotide-diphospho-sugar transferase domain-containing protein n=1 Tax=Apatococcus fuscideae TaxID=2026836 RepID=A0AAW1TF06_9CHLO